MMLVCLALAAWSSSSRSAEVDLSLERKVKAAFLYQFIPYVQWPPQAIGSRDAPFVIAVLGSDDTIADLTEVIGGRTVEGRPVVVRRWRDSDAQGGVHIVYVRRVDTARVAAIARAAQAAGMLLVTEAEGALNQGSMINFHIVDGKVRFDVALPVVEKAGLRVSSRLLAVAHDVRSQP